MAFVLPLSPEMPDRVLGEAERVLRAGGVLAVPTETFYALAASPFDSAAVDRIRAIKGRDEDKPVLVLIGDRRQLADLVQDIPLAAQALMEAFWPGPLTLVMPAAVMLPDGLTCRTGSVAVRHSPHRDLCRLLVRVGPVTGTSANRSGLPAACTAEDVQASLGAEIDLILDGGRTPGVSASTVVDTRNPARILREGPVGRQPILTVLTASGIVLGG
jgi:L-threonylcarbamoyladenylate synthase